jgi:hypothetical protein
MTSKASPTTPTCRPSWPACPNSPQRASAVAGHVCPSTHSLPLLPRANVARCGRQERVRGQAPGPLGIFEDVRDPGRSAGHRTGRAPGRSGQAGRMTGQVLAQLAFSLLVDATWRPHHSRLKVRWRTYRYRRILVGAVPELDRQYLESGSRRRSGRSIPK